MKRFFCEQCQQVKRVRQLPPDVHDNPDPNPPPGFKLLGRCCWHDASGPTRAQLNHRGLVRDAH